MADTWFWEQKINAIWVTLANRFIRIRKAFIHIRGLYLKKCAYTELHFALTWISLFRFATLAITEVDIFLNSKQLIHPSWWRHQMATFSRSTGLFAGNSPVNSPVNSPHKGQWQGALMFSLISAWTNGWENTRNTGDWDATGLYIYIFDTSSRWIKHAHT